MSASKLKLGVLVSGRGTNLQAILDGCAAGEIPAEVAVVVSNRPGVPALERAKKAGVPSVTIPHSRYGKWPGCRPAYERDLVRTLTEWDVQLVVCAGYDRLVGETLLDAFRGRILNIHPSLLPSFPGLHAQADALAYGVKVTGATVFFVDETVDGGPIILQEPVRVLDGDTVESLSARILEVEHRILPLAITLIAEKRVILEGRKVRILEKSGGAS
ncbi:MAG TPA: phosphoribosylglycinamide formyltransferase [Firmicutes bacterium]|nr:phosphoribosylglycinamide formyltransferase [Candidatus Fermentithermobacillaceae bacterium]